MSESKEELVGLAVKEELLTRSFKDSVMKNKGLVIGVAVVVGVVGLAVGVGYLAYHLSAEEDEKTSSTDENSTTAEENSTTAEECSTCEKIRSFFGIEKRIKEEEKKKTSPPPSDEDGGSTFNTKIRSFFGLQ